MTFEENLRFWGMYEAFEDPTLMDILKRIYEGAHSTELLNEGYSKGYTADQLGVFIDSSWNAEDGSVQGYIGGCYGV